MQYTTLGHTGLLVSRLSLGTMTFSGQGVYKVIGSVDPKGADELVKAAIESGINLFDTADVYSESESETTLGRSFKNLNIARKDVVLATKVYSRMRPGHPRSARQGSLHRRLELAGLEDSQGPWDLRAEEPHALRYGSSLLLHRRSRPRTRARSFPGG